MHATTKKIAFAFEQGVFYAYGKRLRPVMHQQLFEMLDDMALALAHRFVVEKEESLKEASWILSSICDDYRVPIPGMKSRSRK
jgi:hypothetical protein